MATSDTIADLLTRIRNASRARHRYVDVKSSKLKLALVKILKETGFVEGYLVKDIEKAGPLRVYLKYKPDRSPLITDLLRVSKPSLRRYVRSGEIPRVRNGMGISVVSTSQGVLEGEEARKRKVGGELLFKVW
jgi:small subunit ribosomal protein S8